MEDSDFTREMYDLAQGREPTDQLAQRAAMRKQTPLGRFGQPAEAGRFVASSDPSFVNDCAFLADGVVVASR
jgi:hypothetical protein